MSVQNIIANLESMKNGTKINSKVKNNNPSDIKELNKKILELQDDLNNKKSTEDALREQIVYLQTNNDNKQLNKKILELQDDLNNKKSTENALREQIVYLQTNNDIKQLNKKILELQDDLSRQKSIEKKLKENTIELDESNSKLKTKIEKLNNKIKNYENQIDNNEKDQINLNVQIKYLEKQIKKPLSNQNIKLDEIIKLEKVIIDLKEQLNELQSILTKRNNDILELEDNYEKSKLDIIKLKSKNDELEHIIEMKNIEINKKINIVKQVEYDKTMHEDEKDNLKLLLNQTTQKYIDLNEKQAQKIREMEHDYEIKLKTMEQTIKVLKDDNLTLTEQLKTKSTRYIKIQDEKNNLMDNLVKANDYNKDLDSVIKSHNKMKIKFNELNSELTKEKTKNFNLQNQLNQHEDYIKKLNNDKVILESNLLKLNDNPTWDEVYTLKSTIKELKLNKEKNNELINKLKDDQLKLYKQIDIIEMKVEKLENNNTILLKQLNDEKINHENMKIQLSIQEQNNEKLLLKNEQNKNDNDNLNKLIDELKLTNKNQFNNLIQHQLNIDNMKNQLNITNQKIKELKSIKNDLNSKIMKLELDLQFCREDNEFLKKKVDNFKEQINVLEEDNWKLKRYSYSGV